MPRPRFILPVFVSTLLALALGAGPAPALDQGWLLTTAYGTFGRLRSFAGDAAWTVSGDLGVVPGDPVGRHHDGRLYVVGRGGASVLQVYDPAAGYALLHEFSLGANRNPQDIAFDDQGDAYVSCYDQAVLLRVDVAAESVVQVIDTSLFADADGLPESAGLCWLDGRLYVACQKLDRDTYQPTGPGVLAVLDTATEQWVDLAPGTPGVQPLTLAGANPYTPLELVWRDGAPRLRVGCVGSYLVLDGGIAEVDPAAGASLGYLVTEQQLGGDVTAFVSTGADCVHALVSDAAFGTSLRRWCAGDATAAVLDAHASFAHADVAWDGDFQVYVADRRLGAEGLRVFDAASGAELTAGAIPTGLPPFRFVLPTAGYPVAAPLPAATGLTLAAPYPNPGNPGARLAIRGQPGAAIHVFVCDLAGRRVQEARLRLGADGAGAFRFVGRDRRGAPLPAGVYRVVAQGAHGFAARSLTLLK